MFCRFFRILLCVLLLTPLSGCNDGPNVVAVSGVITQNGQPLPEVLVNFKPEQGRPSWGVTDTTGRYTLHYTRDQPGALIGRHKVWISLLPKEPLAETSQNRQPPELTALLKKYGSQESSPLVIEVSQATDSLALALD